MRKNKIILAVIILIIIVLICIVIGYFLNNKEEENAENTDNTQNQIITENPETEQELDLSTEIEEKVWEWQHDTLENQGIDESAVESVHDTIDDYPIYAEVIVRNGVIVDEYYKDGYDEESIFSLQSTSKSITSTIFGIVMDMGYIDSLDIPIYNYFPQILEYDNEYKNQITIWNLLTHTTGLSARDITNWDEFRASDNWVDYVLDRPAVSRPGTTFNYFTGNTHLLSAIIQQETGVTTYEFGKEYLFDKLDMDSVECSTDAQGISDAGNGFSMNVYDMAKIGQLYLNQGVWNGEQIVSAEWLEEATTTQFDRSASGLSNYGYQWWIRTFGSNYYHSFFAEGYGGQYIFVVPDLELVVIFTSYYTGDNDLYWDMMNTIVNACY